LLAAVVITAAVGLVDAHAVRRLYRVRRPEFVLWLTSFLGVAVLGVLVGILVAIVLSLADFVRRAWRPYDAVLGREDELKGYHDLERHPNARQVPGLLYRFDAPCSSPTPATSGAASATWSPRPHPASAGWWWRPSQSPTWTPPPPTPPRAATGAAPAAGGTCIRRAEGTVKDRLRRYGLFAEVGAERFFPTVGTAVDGYLRTTGMEWVGWKERPDGRRKG
jgi:hypothetical protein